MKIVWLRRWMLAKKSILWSLEVAVLNADFRRASLSLLLWYIKILCWYLQYLWAQWDKAEQAPCQSYAVVLAVGSRQDTWQRKATSWHWDAWRHRSTSSLKWLCPQTWRDCRNTTATYWRWQLKSGCTRDHNLTFKVFLPAFRWITASFCFRVHSTNTPSNGSAFIRSTLTPAELFRYVGKSTEKAEVRVCVCVCVV